MTTECVIWTGYIKPDGYGQASNGRPAHRVVYEMEVGPIPDGLHIDHLCRIRACVNPEHLEPVTQQENQRRAGPYSRNAQVTHCRQGHPYDEANTYHHPSGSRVCRACNRASVARYKARKSAAPC